MSKRKPDTQFEKSIKAQYKSTSSFISGIALAFIDAFAFMLSICLGFFIINLNPVLFFLLLTE